jgi:GNAT superfamily N-acetyltransferase
VSLKIDGFLVGCGRKICMLTSPAVEMRLAVPGDVEQITLLLPDLAGPDFPERFPNVTAAAFCAWKYFSNPLGTAAVGIATADGRVVSLAAGVPKLVRVGSQTLLAFELGDFITAPAFRKRGLFSTLIRMICDEAKRRGAAFVYVRPNESSFHILTKDLAFQEVQKLDERRFVAPSAVLERKTGVPAALPRRLGADWVARRTLLPRAFPNIRLEPVTRFGAEVDEWWAAVGPKFPFALVRNHEYLNWRYIDCPSPYRSLAAFRDGRFAGYLTSFLFQRSPTGHILDLVTDPDDKEAAGELLRCALNGMLDRGATVVLTWTVHSGSSSAGSAFLQKACPLRDHPPLHMAARFLEDETARTGFPPLGWQLNLGDFDGI